MARPAKNGIAYWSFDVDFFEDKKILLIKGEFGLKGITAFIAVINGIYRGEGYFMKWDADDCILLAEKLGDGCTPEWVGSLIARCCERGLFDGRIFTAYGVLTSRAIQRRYLAVKRDYSGPTALIGEYILVDLSDRSEVTEGVLKRLTVRSLYSENAVLISQNADFAESNADMIPQHATKQSKEKQNTAKQSRAEEKTPHGCALPDEVISEFSSIRQATCSDLRILTEAAEKYGAGRVTQAIRETCAKGGRSAAYVARVLEDSAPRPTQPEGRSAVEQMMYDEWFGGM